MGHFQMGDSNLGWRGTYTSELLPLESMNLDLKYITGKDKEKKEREAGGCVHVLFGLACTE